MAKAKTKKPSKPKQELDGVYFLKIVLYLIIGAQWLWLTNASGSTQVPLPVGLLIGSIFATHDHFQIDRKIEFAILLIAAFVGLLIHSGLFVTLFH